MRLPSQPGQPRASETVKNEPSMALLRVPGGEGENYFRVETAEGGKVLVVCIGANPEGWENVSISGAQPLPFGGPHVSVRVASFPSHRGAAFSFSSEEWGKALAGLESYELGRPVPMEQAAVSGARGAVWRLFDRLFGKA